MLQRSGFSYQHSVQVEELSSLRYGTKQQAGQQESQQQDCREIAAPRTVRWKKTGKREEQKLTQVTLKKEPPTKPNANTNWSLLHNSWKVVVDYKTKLSFRQRPDTSCFMCSDSAHKAVLAVCSQVAASPISRVMYTCFPILIFSQQAPLAFLQANL